MRTCFFIDVRVIRDELRRKGRTALMIGFTLLFAAALPVAVTAAEEKSEAPLKGEAVQGRTGAIAARVNGVDITEAAVETRMARVLAGRRHDGSPGDMEAIRKEALNKLILQELAYQRAKAVGLRIDPKELDDAITEIKEKAGGEEKYRDSMEKRQMTEEGLRKDLERNLMVKHIFEKEVSSGIVIPEEDIKKEYERVKDQLSRPEKVIVDDVVLFLDMDDKNSPGIAEDILKKIAADPEKDPSNVPSDGAFVVRELELKESKEKDLYDAAKKLDAGQLSGVIRTPDSFHIIKLKKYSPEVKADFAQVRGLIERQLRAAAQQKRMAEWEAELKKDAKIEIFSPGEAGEKKE